MEGLPRVGSPALGASWAGACVSSSWSQGLGWCGVDTGGRRDLCEAKDAALGGEVGGASIGCW